MSYCGHYESAGGPWPCTVLGKGYEMVTDRYFSFKNNDGFGVWDRHKNEPVEMFPRSRQGGEKADALAARLNRQVRAREQS